SPSSISRNLSSIKMFHRFLIGEGMTGHDPTQALDAPKLPRSLPAVMSFEEVEAMIRQPDTSKPLGLRDRAILETLYATGMRVSEVITLTQGQVYRDDEMVRVLGKGSKMRLVPVGKPALEWIIRYIQEARVLLAARGAGRDALFLNVRGKPMSRMS